MIGGGGLDVSAGAKQSFTTAAASNPRNGGQPYLYPASTMGAEGRYSHGRCGGQGWQKAGH